MLCAGAGVGITARQVVSPCTGAPHHGPSRSPCAPSTKSKSAKSATGRCRLRHRRRRPLRRLCPQHRSPRSPPRSRFSRATPPLRNERTNLPRCAPCSNSPPPIRPPPLGFWNAPTPNASPAATCTTSRPKKLKASSPCCPRPSAKKSQTTATRRRVCTRLVQLADERQREQWAAHAPRRDPQLLAPFPPDPNQSTSISVAETQNK